MRHDVDAPAGLPTIIHRIESAISRDGTTFAVAEPDARVGNKEINGSDVLLDFVNEFAYCGFICDVDDARNAADFGSHRLCRRRINIDDNHPRTIAMQAPAECAAYAVTTAGNYCRSNAHGALNPVSQRVVQHAENHAWITQQCATWKRVNRQTGKDIEATGDAGNCLRNNLTCKIGCDDPVA